MHSSVDRLLKFQHTAARRRLVKVFVQILFLNLVSTHSRPKAAGPMVG